MYVLGSSKVYFASKPDTTISTLEGYVQSLCYLDLVYVGKSDRWKQAQFNLEKSYLAFLGQLNENYKEIVGSTCPEPNFPFNDENVSVVYRIADAGMASTGWNILRTSEPIHERYNDERQVYETMDKLVASLPDNLPRTVSYDQWPLEYAP